jgi:hypothetical protein
MVKPPPSLCGSINTLTLTIERLALLRILRLTLRIPIFLGLGQRGRENAE